MARTISNWKLLKHSLFGHSPVNLIYFYLCIYINKPTELREIMYFQIKYIHLTRCKVQQILRWQGHGHCIRRSQRLLVDLVDMTQQRVCNENPKSCLKSVKVQKDPIECEPSGWKISEKSTRYTTWTKKGSPKIHHVKKSWAKIPPFFATHLSKTSHLSTYPISDLEGGDQLVDIGMIVASVVKFHFSCHTFLVGSQCRSDLGPRSGAWTLQTCGVPIFFVLKAIQIYVKIM